MEEECPYMEEFLGHGDCESVKALQNQLSTAQTRIAELEGELTNCMTALGYWGSCDDCPKGKELESQRDKAVAEVERLRMALKTIRDCFEPNHMNVSLSRPDYYSEAKEVLKQIYGIVAAILKEGGEE